MLPEQLLQVFGMLGAAFCLHGAQLSERGQVLQGVLAGAGFGLHGAQRSERGQLLQSVDFCDTISHFLQQPQPFLSLLWPELLGLLHAAKEKAINRIETNFIINLHSLQLTQLGFIWKVF